MQEISQVKTLLLFIDETQAFCDENKDLIWWNESWIAAERDAHQPRRRWRAGTHSIQYGCQNRPDLRRREAASAGCACWAARWMRESTQHVKREGSSGSMSFNPRP